MNMLFSFKLALTNLRKHTQLYIPYIISTSAMAAMYYIVQFLYSNKGLEGNGSISDLRDMMSYGANVTAVFIVIFLFYTNSFIIKRRKKEIGLYGILGLEKRHVSRIMLMEAIILFITCLMIGLLFGILLSKAIFLLLLKILDIDVKFGLEISYFAIRNTAILFSIVFLTTLVYNLFQVHVSQPITLLNADKAGEKEPRIKWVMTISGFIFITIGYYIALSDMNIIQALPMFFLAVILVIIGTYFLFIAGSIALLKALRKNKRYYYKTNHFVSVSGMIYRMKQNAAGLASICILSTIVLIMISTTLSMYIGLEDILRTRFPKNISVNAYNVNEDTALLLDEMINQEIFEANAKPITPIRYRHRFFLAQLDSNGDIVDSQIDYSQNHFYTSPEYLAITCILLSDYNVVENKNETLDNEQILLYTVGAPPVDTSLKLGDISFDVKNNLEDVPVLEGISQSSVKGYILIVKDENVIKKIENSLENDGNIEAPSYKYGFDVDISPQEQILLRQNISNKLVDLGIRGHVESAEASRKDMFEIYGGFLFLGLFLGTLFIFATILIIYYKQISEGYDDRERFRIMQNVGMSKAEVKSSIRSQVLTVFYLPLVTAAIHIAFSFKIVIKLLEMLYLTNISLFAVCTIVSILIFACFYSIIYAITARTYYRIVD